MLIKYVLWLCLLANWLLLRIVVIIGAGHNKKKVEMLINPPACIIFSKTFLKFDYIAVCLRVRCWRYVKVLPGERNQRETDRKTEWVKKNRQELEGEPNNSEERWRRRRRSRETT